MGDELLHTNIEMYSAGFDHSLIEKEHAFTDTITVPNKLLANNNNKYIASLTVGLYKTNNSKADQKFIIKSLKTLYSEPFIVPNK